MNGAFPEQCVSPDYYIFKEISSVGNQQTQVWNYDDMNNETDIFITFTLDNCLPVSETYTDPTAGFSVSYFYNFTTIIENPSVWTTCTPSSELSNEHKRSEQSELPHLRFMKSNLFNGRQ